MTMPAAGAPVRGAGKRSLTALISSAGRRVALMNSFRRAAAELDIDLRVLACDRMPEWSSACQMADDCFQVPPVKDGAYIPALKRICEQEAVDLLVPTIDPELALLSAARNDFLAQGIAIAVSDPTVIGLAGDKLATANQLASAGMPTPRSASLEQALLDPDAWSGAIVVKPRHGSAGRDIHILPSAHALSALPRTGEPLMVQELLTGDEYTVNIFIDDDGALRAAVPHRRVAVRAGEVEKGVTARIPLLEQLAVRLAAALPGARGPLCFQAMLGADGAASIFEINARFGGGYPLADHAGAPFARWMLEQRCGMEVSAHDNWRSGVTMLRYDDAVFL